MRTLLTSFAILATLGLSAGLTLSACDGASPALECVDNGDCGDGEACLLNACEAVQCLASAQCGIGEYCDTETYACRIGCEADTDCRAGETCNTGSNTCEAYGCRDSYLDCGIGEECNLVTGECNSVGEHCDKCEPDPWGFDPQGTCRQSNSVCGSFLDAPDRYFCFQTCNPNDEQACPRGYSCIQGFFGTGDAYCAAFCPDLWDNGWK